MGLRGCNLELARALTSLAQALRTLVEGLERRGWRVSRRGRRWFSMHMQLTFGEEPDQTRQFEGPEAGRKGTMS